MMQFYEKRIIVESRIDAIGKETWEKQSSFTWTIYIHSFMLIESPFFLSFLLLFYTQ